MHSLVFVTSLFFQLYFSANAFNLVYPPLVTYTNLGNHTVLKELRSTGSTEVFFKILILKIFRDTRQLIDFGVIIVTILLMDLFSKLNLKILVTKNIFLQDLTTTRTSRIHQNVKKCFVIIILISCPTLQI